MRLRNLIFGVVFIATATTTTAAAAEPPAKITGIRAQLYYEGKATFSGDILAQKDISLWNTIIGEGGAGGASNHTLVTVEVTGKDVPVGQWHVEVSATGFKGRLLARQRMHLSIYDDNTKFHAPLFLYNTGCDPVSVTARLVSKKSKSKPVKATIPFACGE